MVGSGFSSRRTPPPYLVNNLEDLPLGLRQLAKQTLAAKEPAVTIFVVPKQMISKKLEGLGGMRSVPDQALIFTTDGLLHILGSSKPDHPGQTAYLRGDSLIYAHLSLILLYGRLELCGTHNGALTKIVIEYNAVSHHLVQPAMQRFLHLSWGHAYPVKSYDVTTSRFLYEIRNTSFKYRRGLEDYALQTGESLLGCVVQPPILRRFLSIFRLRVAPPVLLALTQSQLIIIEEGMTSATSLGWYFTFCPRVCITGIEFKPNNIWQDMCIHLRRGNLTAERRTKVENDAAQDWQTLWTSQQ
jgi:hypothetical protein